MKHKYTSYTIANIVQLLKSDLRSTQQKAERQGWPFTKGRDQNPGSLIHFYSMDTLPDEIQVAWASWDEKKYQEALELEKQKRIAHKSGTQKEDELASRVLKPLTGKDVAEILQWPGRKTYYKKYPPGMGRKKKIYDDSSIGLCSEALQILIERFGSQLVLISEDRQKQKDSATTKYDHDPNTDSTVIDPREQGLWEEERFVTKCTLCGQPHNMMASLKEKDEMMAFLKKRLDKSEGYQLKYEKLMEEQQGKLPFV